MHTLVIIVINILSLKNFFRFHFLDRCILVVDPPSLMRIIVYNITAVKLFPSTSAIQVPIVIERLLQIMGNRITIRKYTELKKKNVFIPPQKSKHTFFSWPIHIYRYLSFFNYIHMYIISCSVGIITKYIILCTKSNNNEYFFFFFVFSSFAFI